MSKINKELGSEYLKTMTQLATAGFGLAAALAWNETIKALIERFFNAGSDIVSKLVYAFIVTAIAVGVTYYLGKLTQRVIAKEEAEENKK